MRVRSINGNVLTVEGTGHPIVVGDRLSADDNVDGSTLSAGSMLVKDVQPDGDHTAVTVDSAAAGNVIDRDYLFVTHSIADQERMDRIARRATHAVDSLGLAVFDGATCQAIPNGDGTWSLVWRLT